MKTAFKINQTLHYLSIGLWVGALMGFVFAATSMFAISKQYDVAVGIAPFNNPAFAKHSADILAGSMVIRTMLLLQYLQVICAVVLIVTTFLHSTIFSRWMYPRLFGKRNLLRIALVIVSVAIMAVAQFVIFPHMQDLYQTMYNPDLSAAAQASARQAFDSHHALSQNLTTVMVVLLIITAFLTSFTQKHDALDLDQD